MPDLTEKFEFWGTFSVMDHLRRGAFLAEVVLYDKLLIPVPPDPAQAETAADRAFAERQWQRWVEQGWMPERQRELLAILAPVAVPIEWDRQHHELWAEQFATYTSKRPADAAAMVGQMMAGWMTGQVLLKELPAMAAGAVAVAPYGSLEELERELGITERDSLQRRRRASSWLPGELVSLIVARQFLVPADDDWDELDLLREAVDVAETAEYKQARRNFHRQMLQFVRDKHTDEYALATAVEAMDEELAKIDEVVRKRRLWRRVEAAVFFTQVALDLASAPVNPARVGHAVSTVVDRYSPSEKLGNPADPYQQGPAGALLYHAQQQLSLGRGGKPPDSRLERLKASLFARD